MRESLLNRETEKVFGSASRQPRLEKFNILATYYMIMSTEHMGNPYFSLEMNLIEEMFSNIKYYLKANIVENCVYTCTV